jgi:TRAP-type mannitol/chloroaromatic compound transport system substrate-binding protein
MMRRRAFIARSGARAAAAVVAGGTLAGASANAAGAATAAGAADPALRWRLASSFPRSLDTLFGAAELFSRQVAALTGGKFQISVHAAGEITPAFGVVDAVQQGAVDCAHTAPYYFFGKDETFALGCAIPFGLNSRQTTAWMMRGNGLKLMREFYRNYDIINFPAGNTGAQMGGWFRKEIRSLDDFKGLKMRIGGFGGRIIEKIGAIPQNLPGGDIYPALEKGTIDAAEWVGPYDDLKLGFNKIAPYYYYPAWWEGGAQCDLYVNLKAWQALPPDYQAAVETAAAQTHVDMQANYDVKNPQALKELYAGGTRLRAFPADMMNAAFKASMTYYDQLSASNPRWKKVYDDFNAFRRDQNLWFRFAEAGFDDFMQNQKL